MNIKQYLSIISIFALSVIFPAIVHAETEFEKAKKQLEQKNSQEVNMSDFKKESALGSVGETNAGSLVISILLFAAYITFFIVVPIMLMYKLRKDALKNPMHRSRVALLWGLGPGILFLGNLISYPVSSFVAYASGASGLAVLIFRGMSTLQSIFGIIYMILIPVGIIIAVVIAMRDHKPSTPVVQ